jgi:hypothetical protein
MIAAIVMMACAFVPLVAAQENDANQSQTQRFEQFAKSLTNAKLVGHFTVNGAGEDKLTAEEYHIHEVKKLEDGDYWMFTARVKYGGRDVTVPMPLEVKWAANTAVITLDNVDIPMLGKFSSRVLIDGNRYAGTWSHGEVGGHLFGEIQQNKAEEGPATDSKQK